MNWLTDQLAEQAMNRSASDYALVCEALAEGMLPYGWMPVGSVQPSDEWHDAARFDMTTKAPMEVPQGYVHSLPFHADQAYAGRAWHDAVHLIAGLGFDFASEFDVTEIQADQMRRFNCYGDGFHARRKLAYLLADNAQSLWLRAFGAYPTDQAAFNATMAYAIMHGGTVPGGEPADAIVTLMRAVFEDRVYAREIAYDRWMASADTPVDATL